MGVGQARSHGGEGGRKGEESGGDFRTVLAPVGNGGGLGVGGGAGNREVEARRLNSEGTRGYRMSYLWERWYTMGQSDCRRNKRGGDDKTCGGRKEGIFLTGAENKPEKCSLMVFKGTNYVLAPGWRIVKARVEGTDAVSGQAGHSPCPVWCPAPTTCLPRTQLRDHPTALSLQRQSTENRGHHPNLSHLSTHSHR